MQRTRHRKENHCVQQTEDVSVPKTSREGDGVGKGGHTFPGDHGMSEDFILDAEQRKAISVF